MLSTYGMPLSNLISKIIVRYCFNSTSIGFRHRSKNIELAALSNNVCSVELPTWRTTPHGKLSCTRLWKQPVLIWTRRILTIQIFSPICMPWFCRTFILIFPLPLIQLWRFGKTQHIMFIASGLTDVIFKLLLNECIRASLIFAMFFDFGTMFQGLVS